MAEPFLPPGVARPDFHIAAIGRSGSTMLCNWLTSPPDYLAFNEPFFFHPRNSRILRIELAGLGMAVGDEEWDQPDRSPAARFERIMAPRLAGRRWALKEVLTSEHRTAIERLEPLCVVLNVRDIADVALSFFEKHRLQKNMDRFDDDWVVNHCRTEAHGLVALHSELERRKIPILIVRYEDFIQREECRTGLAAFVGWPGGGMITANLEQFDRGFEVDHHGKSVSPVARTRDERILGRYTIDLANTVASDCEIYQRVFGYL